MLKTPWHDGTRHLLFEPLELIGRLTALIPRPHKNLLVYHGVFAPRAKWRSRVVSYLRPAAAADADSPERATAEPQRAPRHRAREWATLMRRAFELDVLACPSCGARLKLIACITDPAVVRRILHHLRLPTDVPEPHAARAPPWARDASFEAA